MEIRQKKSFLNSIGFIVVLYYLFFTYIPQMLFHTLMKEEYSKKYFGIMYSPFSVFIVLFFFILGIVLIDRVLPRVKIKIKTIHFNNIISIINLLGIVIFLIASIYFYMKYDISFRHQHRLRETGIIIKLLWFLKMYIYFYVFFLFVKFTNDKLNSLDRFKLLLILIGWFLSVTSSLQMPLIIIVLFLLLSNNNKLFFKQKKTFNLLNAVVLFFVGLFIVFFMIFIGYANKIGIEGTLELFEDPTKIYMVIAHIITRVSSSYVSLLVVLNEHIFDLFMQLNVIFGHLDTFFLRINSFLPIFNVSMEDIETVSRTNFLITHIDNYLPRSGASPGLLATIFYMPIFPLNFLFILLYTLLIIRVLNMYFNKVEREFSIITKFILLYFIFVLFETPLNLLVVIDPIIVFFCLFLVGHFFINNRIEVTK